MYERITMLGSIFLVVLVGLLVRPVAADGPKEEPKKEEPKKDADYVKLRVLVEIRGTLRHTDKGTFLDTKEETYTPFLTLEGTNKLNKNQSEVTWELDVAAAKLTPKHLKGLGGKRVIVNGTAELRIVVVGVALEKLFIGGTRVKGGYPVTSMELERKLTVTGLKALEEDSAGPPKPMADR